MTIPLLEIWLPVVGYEGRYEVSNFGRVRSLRSHSGPWRNGPRPLRLQSHGQYYFSVVLKPRPEKKRYVHRMVLETFAGPCPPGHVCDHIDGDGCNNRLDNLRWIPETENHKRRAEHGGAACGPAHPFWKHGRKATSTARQRRLYAQRVSSRKAVA